MGFAERNTWTQLVASLIGAVVYGAIVVPQLWQRPVAEIEWAWPMLWTIVVAIVASIVASIGWGIAVGIRDRDEAHRTDQRDREIERFGDNVGQAFLVIGALGALLLAAYEMHWFWIGNALFAGFFLSAFLGGLARIAAYRRGF